MTACVLDAWAVIAWLEDEPAAARVRALLEQAANRRVELSISMINAGEVYYHLARKNGQANADDFLSDLAHSLPVSSRLPSYDTIVQAARLKSRYPISYADAFAAATAMELNAALLTGDPELRSVSELSLEWIGAGS